MKPFPRSLFALALALPALAAAEPLTVTHQGYLLGANDAPVDDPALELTFKLFNTLQAGDTAEKLVWQSKACRLAVKQGRYAVVLGGECNGETPLATEHLPASEARYLEVAIGSTRLLPRLALTAAPVAAVARNAEKVGGLDLRGLDARFDAKYAPLAGSTSGGYALLNPSSPQAGDLKITGGVRAGDVTASGNVSIAGNATVAGDATAAHLAVTGDASVGGGLSVTGGLSASGGLSVTGGVTARDFSGSGAALTGLNASALTTGTLPDARLSGTYTGPLTLSNALNVFAGDGAGVVNVNAAKLGGLTLADLDGRYARVSGSGGGSVAFAGPVKIGNGSGATCDSTTAGTLRWDGTNFLGCDGSEWRQLNNQPPPGISGVSPGTGSTFGGTKIVITGTRFVSGATVTIGGVAATNVTFDSATQLSAFTPAGSTGVKDLRVVNPDGQGANTVFTYVDPTVFAFTGSNQTFTVPAGVTQINVKMWGAGGGGGRTTIVRGGSGGFATGTIPVTPGQQYTVVVGQGGARIVTGTGAGAGGGYSGVFLGAIGQVNAKIIAGGGGGGGYYEDATYGSSGGNGGGATGGDGAWPGSSYYASRGMGGTQSAGGAGGVYNGGWIGGSGSALLGGGGANGSNSGNGGAGGATYGGGGAVGLAGGGSPYGTGGGGGGFWGGGGGSNNAPMGGGGGSGYIASGVLNGSTTRNGTPGQPDGITEPTYASGVAWGGYALSSSTDGGGNGRVVVYW